MALHADARKNSSSSRDKDKLLKDSIIVEELVREAVHAHLRKNCKDRPNCIIIKLARDGWHNPPLDWCDTTGYYVGETKYTSYEFAELDKTRSLGAAIPMWKLHNLRLACGCSKTPSDKFFRAAWFVYCDVLGKLYYLTLAKIDKIIATTLITGTKNQKGPHVHFGTVIDKKEKASLPEDFTEALFIPSALWTPLGTVKLNLD
jgi:hypothetical protein